MTEKRHLKDILKEWEMWNTFRLFILGIGVLTVSRILLLIGDIADGFESQAIGWLIILGGIMIAGPVRKMWDNKYRSKKK
jgi:hypothetical protein